MPESHLQEHENFVEFMFHGHRLRAHATGALQLLDHGVLVVSDLHLGKSRRIARRGGTLLPPYETSDALCRLACDLVLTRPNILICLGDSFDDDQAATEVFGSHGDQIVEIQRKIRWIWVSGNHDANPEVAGGEVVQEFELGDLMFRHVASAECEREVSGHYHPKASVSARGRRVSRSCFLVDQNRIILPAYGTYTGGMDCREEPLVSIMCSDALAILTGTRASIIKMPVRSANR